MRVVTRALVAVGLCTLEVCYAAYGGTYHQAYQQTGHNNMQAAYYYGQPGNGYVQPGNGYVQPGNGYGQPRRGHRQPGSGHMHTGQSVNLHANHGMQPAQAKPTQKQAPISLPADVDPALAQYRLTENETKNLSKDLMDLRKAPEGERYVLYRHNPSCPYETLKVEAATDQSCKLSKYNKKGQHKPHEVFYRANGGWNNRSPRLFRGQLNTVANLREQYKDQKFERNNPHFRNEYWKVEDVVVRGPANGSRNKEIALKIVPCGTRTDFPSNVVYLTREKLKRLLCNTRTPDREKFTIRPKIEEYDGSVRRNNYLPYFYKKFGKILDKDGNIIW